MLSAKAEKFLQAHLQGMPASKAYQQAYGCTPKVAKACASRLLKSPKVKARVQQFVKRMEPKTLLTMQRRRELLKDRAESATVKDMALVQIILADAKLAGELTDKVEHGGSVEHRHVITEERRKELIEKRRAAIFGAS